jgi:hypothetical protein
MVIFMRLPTLGQRIRAGWIEPGGIWHELARVRAEVAALESEFKRVNGEVSRLESELARRRRSYPYWFYWDYFNSEYRLERDLDAARRRAGELARRLREARARIIEPLDPRGDYIMWNHQGNSIDLALPQFGIAGAMEGLKPLMVSWHRPPLTIRVVVPYATSAARPSRPRLASHDREDHRWMWLGAGPDDDGSNREGDPVGSFDSAGGAARDRLRRPCRRAAPAGAIVGGGGRRSARCRHEDGRLGITGHAVRPPAPPEFSMGGGRYEDHHRLRGGRSSMVRPPKQLAA